MSEQYSPALHSRLRRLIENASPAPWCYEVEQLDPRTGEYPDFIADKDGETVIDGPELTQANLSLITEGISALTALLDEIEQLNDGIETAQSEAWEDGYADCLCDIEAVYDIDREVITHKTANPYINE